MQIKHLVPAFVILFLLMGCSEERPKSSKNGFSFRLPWYTEEGQYSIQTVKIKTIKDLSTGSGDVAQFIKSPKVESNKLNGPTPFTRYMINSDGVIVPLDIISTQIFSIYAHLEKLKNLDESLGVLSLNKWPRDVGLMVRYKEDGEFQTNNAMYSPQLDAMLFVPYVDNKIPLAVNGAVIAHEHFHSLFDKIVTQKVLKKLVPNWIMISPHQNVIEPIKKHSHQNRVTGRGNKADSEEEVMTAELYHTYLLRALNEGIADFWGWLHTGSTSFVSDSIAKANGTRVLSDQKIRLTTQEAFLSGIENRNENGRMFYLYEVGTLYASVLKNLSTTLVHTRGLDQSNAKLKVSQMLLNSLKTLSDKLLSLGENEFLNPDIIVVLMQSQIAQSLGDVQKEECQYFSEVMSEKNRNEELTQCVHHLVPLKAEPINIEEVK